MIKPAPTNDSFDRFREMTPKVISTPKSVADARATAEKAKKTSAKPA